MHGISSLSLGCFIVCRLLYRPASYLSALLSVPSSPPIINNCRSLSRTQSGDGLGEPRALNHQLYSPSQRLLSNNTFLLRILLAWNGTEGAQGVVASLLSLVYRLARAA